MCFANAGIPVKILEVEAAALARGLETIEKNYASQVKRGRLAQVDMDTRMGLISGALDYAELRARMLSSKPYLKIWTSRSKCSNNSMQR